MKPKARRAKALTSPTGAEFCGCEEDDETTQQKLAGMNSTARNREWRARAAAAGYCARGGYAHGKATRGTICAECLEYIVARRREQRQRAREEQKKPKTQRRKALQLKR